MLLYTVLGNLNISNEDYEKIKSRIISTGEMIIHLGTSLADLIDRAPPSCQGLIRLCIKDFYPKRPPKFLTIEQWITLIDQRLRIHLAKIKIMENESILEALVGDLLIYQNFVTN